MKYFGTDGIRMKAEKFTPEVIEAVVRGLVEYAGDGIKVLIGGDTRESTEWILAELARALESFGLEYGDVGVLPTPGINDCFLPMGFNVAIDVTASHNRYEDNGIKIFERESRDDGGGVVDDKGESAGPRKLCAEGREAVERALDAGVEGAVLGVAPTLREDLHEDALGRYLEHLREYAGAADLGGVRIGMDCANGAMSVVSGRVFRELGAEVAVINDDATYGTKINDGCGSTQMGAIAKLVVDGGLDYGVAFDGDGDRCLMVDEKGELVDGDQILAILAEYLGVSSLVVTVMANQGLMNWLDARGLKYTVTPVGDSEVYAAMQAGELELGGEQSGHIILPGEPMGDGMLTALMMAKAIAASGVGLGELAGKVKRLPQVMVNFEADEGQKKALEKSDEAREILREYDGKLERSSGRMLVRASGTEDLIRVTMWGDDEREIERLAGEVVEKLQKVL